MPESMKSLGITKSKITKVTNGEKLPHLEITQVVLKHFHTVNNNYQQDWRVLHIFVPNKSLVKGHGFLSFAKNVGENIAKMRMKKKEEKLLIIWDQYNSIIMVY